MSKCLRCSLPNDRGLAVCLGCGADLRPMSGRIFLMLAAVMVVFAVTIPMFV